MTVGENCATRNTRENLPVHSAQEELRQTDRERGGEDDCSAQNDGFQFRQESCRMESDRSAQNDRLVIILLL